MPNTRTTDTFVVKLGDKRTVCVRTDTGRFFQIAHHRLLTDGNVDGNDGLVSRAEPISSEQLADLIEKYGIVKQFSFRIKGMASNKRVLSSSQMRISNKEETISDI